MAKDTKEDISQPGNKNTAATESIKDKEKPNYPISVYLPQHEKNYIENLADQLGVSRHALMQFAVKHFIAQHRIGVVEIPVKTKTVTEIESP